MAIAGRYVWLFTALCIAFLVIFFWSLAPASARSRSIDKGYHGSFVCWKWNDFVELFGTKETRIDLLNGSAPRFFRIVQNVLWEETLLHLARLTDSPDSVGKRS